MVRVPIKKVTGHLHLEGSVPSPILARVATRNGLAKHASAFQRYRPGRFKSFAQFAQLIVMTAQTLRLPKDFFEAGLLLGERLRRENVVYAEVIWVPQLYFRHSIGLGGILHALNAARDRVLAQHGITINWIVDLVRGYPANSERVVTWLGTLDLKSSNIVAVGLGGNETHPLADLVDPLLAARSLGLEIYPHAGEQCGAKSIDEVIDRLSPQRIAHGIRAAESRATLEEIRTLGIQLDVCPTSNVRLGVYQSLRDLPIRKLVEAECRFSINTDDPALFAIDLDTEVSTLMSAHELTMEFVERTYQWALDAAFLNEAERSEIRKRLVASEPSTPAT
ncbi:MAG: hypothetical protein HRU30_08320 [Rhodobacteraceae bacterium]|nr:hypothetical protein [Paracoccaceae bacterium]